MKFWSLKAESSHEESTWLWGDGESHWDCQLVGRVTIAIGCILLLRIKFSCIIKFGHSMHVHVCGQIWQVLQSPAIPVHIVPTNMQIVFSFRLVAHIIFWFFINQAAPYVFNLFSMECYTMFSIFSLLSGTQSSQSSGTQCFQSFPNPVAHNVFNLSSTQWHTMFSILYKSSGTDCWRKPCHSLCDNPFVIILAQMYKSCSQHIRPDITLIFLWQYNTKCCKQNTARKTVKVAAKLW